MKVYLAAFVTMGVLVPILVHFAARDSMPWWPETASMAIIACGAAAIAIFWKDPNTRRRL